MPNDASSLDLEGVYVPIVTPFDGQDEIDFDVSDQVIDHCLNAGVRGLVLAGTTGEYYALTPAERLHVFTHARDVAQDRAQLIAGCNAASTKEVIGYGLAAGELGYDALMLAAPPTSLPSQRELAAHFAAVANAVGLPIVLYNYPARAGVEIGFECLDAIADLPEIVAIKESSGDFSRFLQLKHRYAGRVEVMCGSDDQAVDYFFWGVRSWLAGTGNVLPRQHVAVMDAANRGDHDEARRIFTGILPWVQNMESGSYNAKAKAGLAHQGIDCGPVRQPMLALLPEVTEALLADLDAALAVSLTPA
jgi:4-hydroxy-tetrahydrodipicolinate synthase